MTVDAATRPVTVLGLGLMGSALAGAFLRAGHPTTVWNRSAGKAEALAAEGAQVAGSVAEAVAASPLVVVCVSDYHAVRELLGPIEGFGEGRTFVNLTSGTSREARELAAWGGGAYVDGAILAVPSGIGAAETPILYSGAADAFEEHADTLRALGGAAAFLGADHGLASLHDVAVLSLMWGTLNGFLQGVAVLGAAGVDAASFAPLAAISANTVAGWLGGYAEQIDSGAYPGDDAALDTHVAAMGHLIDESEAVGLDASFPKAIKQLADRAVAAGRSKDSYAALVEELRKR